MTNKKSESEADWEQFYKKVKVEQMRWYYEELDPDLASALLTHQIGGGTFLDIGTGAGTQAIALAKRGFEVIASDISQTATMEAEARARAQKVKVSVVQDDILNTALQKRVDFAFDRGCFQTIFPHKRERYVTVLSQLLPPGGLLFLKCFSQKEQTHRGPYRFTPDQIDSIFSDEFEILSISDTVYQGTLKEWPNALFCVLKRRHGVQSSMRGQNMRAEVQKIIDGYVESLKETGWIESEVVETAFRQVQRHQLIEKIYLGRFDLPSVTTIDPSKRTHLELVYSNRALFIHWPEISASSPPSLVALVLERLGLEPGMRVLEIGAGSGYNAALMAQIVTERGSVTTIDIQEDLVAQTARCLTNAGYGRVNVLAKDGFYGCPEHAPYDRIMGTVGCMLLSPHWVEQLSQDGCMFIPLTHGGISNCPLVRIEKKEGRLLGKVVAYANFMPVLGDSALNLWPSDRKAAHFRQLIKNTTPNQERPLFEGLKNMPNPTPRPGKGAVRLEFLYYLALHNSKTFLYRDNAGVGELNGFLLITEEGIKLYGTHALTVYQEVKQVYDKWMELGRPRMLDYQIEFVPITENNNSNQEKPTLPPNTWAIDRKYYRQLVRL